MSALGLKPVAVVPPVLRNDPNLAVAIPLGGVGVNWRQFPATSFSQGVVNFSTPIPDGNYVDPRVAFRGSVILTFAGTSTSGNLLKYGFDAPRAFPLMNAIGEGSINIFMNSENLAEQQQIQDVLLRLGTWRDDNKGFLSTTPCTLDRLPNYNDWTETLPMSGPFPRGNAGGAVGNVLGSYGDNTAHGDEPRGAFSGCQILTNTSTSATVQLDFLEMIQVSPLGAYKGERGFSGLNTWTWTFTLESGSIKGFARMWSHDAIGGNNITSITGTWNVAPSIFMNFWQPDPSQNLERWIWPWTQISQRFITAGTAPIAPGATFTFASIPVQLELIPQRIIIVARLTNSSRDWTTSDTYATITAMTMQWGGTGTFFSNMTNHDLFRLANDRGYKCTWSQWDRYQGSVLAIMPGVDFPLGSDAEGRPYAVGIAGRQTFNLSSITIRNNMKVGGTFDLFVFGVSDGAITFGGSMNVGGAQKTPTVITEADVIAARNGPTISMDVFKGLSGGSIWSDFKSFAHKGLGALAGIADYAGKAVPYIRKAQGLFGSGLKKVARPALIGGGVVDDSRAAQFAPAIQRQPNPSVLSGGSRGPKKQKLVRLPLSLI